MARQVVEITGRCRFGEGHPSDAGRRASGPARAFWDGLSFLLVELRKEHVGKKMNPDPEHRRAGRESPLSGERRCFLEVATTPSLPLPSACSPSVHDFPWPVTRTKRNGCAATSFEVVDARPVNRFGRPLSAISI